MKEPSEIQKALVEGRDFDKTLILDNFYQEVDVVNSSSADLAKLLDATIRGTENPYIIRSTFIILCDLTSLGLITNEYVAFSYLKDFLASSDEMLQLIALKYLPRFPSVYSKERSKVEILSDSDNADVASQAYFCIGLSILISPSSSRNSEEVVLNFSKAKQHFIAAKQSIDNREDASFFLLFIEYFEGVFLLDQDKWKSAFNQIEHNLKSRNLYQVGSKELEFDFLIFKLIQLLKASLDLVGESDSWLEFRLPLRSLSEVYYQIQTLQRLSGSHSETVQMFYQSSVRLLEERVYMASLVSSKHRLQKLHDITEEDNLQQFLAYLLSLFPTKNKPSKDNPELLALLSNRIEAGSALEIYKEVISKDNPAMSALEHLLKKDWLGQLAIRTGSILGQEVFQSLTQKINHYLPDYPEAKKVMFFKILEEVIKYTRATFVGHDKKKFAFLYSKTVQANNLLYLGDSAKEEDLQDSMLDFFQHSKIADGLDHEKSKFVDGGRVDIVYSKELITIPIELKKSLYRPDLGTLENSYIAQAQTYTAGYDQLGIFVLLELSDKSTEPPPNFQDWFRVHHLPPSTNLPIKYPDYVVSVVIPGNRVTPSAKSTYR